jgi:hypothetical protein
MMHQMLNSASLGGSIRDNRTSLSDGRSVGVGNYVGKAPQYIYHGLCTNRHFFLLQKPM